jgi:hypothetical protein
MSDLKTNNPLEYERRVGLLKKCGQNQGPHSYQPVTWLKSATAEHVTQFMCMVCLNRVNTETLYKYFPEITVE